MMLNFISVKTHNAPAINLLVHLSNRNKLLEGRANELLLWRSHKMILLHSLACSARHGTARHGTARHGTARPVEHKECILAP